MRRIAERAVVQEQDWQRAAPRRAPGADQVVGAEHLTAMRDALVVERPADLLVEVRERDVPQQRRVHGGLRSRSRARGGGVGGTGSWSAHLHCWLAKEVGHDSRRSLN